MGVPCPAAANGMARKRKEGRSFRPGLLRLVNWFRSKEILDNFLSLNQLVLRG
jgi:hypothetical protein